MSFETVPCANCGSTENNLQYTLRDENYGYAGQFQIVTCANCDLTFLNPRPDEGTIGGFYPASADYSCFANRQAPPPLNLDHPLIATAGIATGRLCDVGCGVGDFLLAAQLAGWEVAGVEPSGFARDVANERLGDAVVQPSITDVNGQFDIVTMWHVFEHVHDPPATLRQIGDILKPNGMVAIGVPNYGSAERRIFGRYWIALDAPRHLFHYTPRTLRMLVETAGFEVVSLTHTVAPNSLSANLLRRARQLLLDTRKDSDAKRIVAAASEDADSSGQGATVDEQVKDRSRQLLGKLVWPWAWLNARMGFAPEIILYARKHARKR